jgi:hypothetical protein
VDLLAITMAMRALCLFLGLIGECSAISESRMASSRLQSSRMRLSLEALRGGAEDFAPPERTTAGSASRDVALSEALAMLSDGSMLPQIRQLVKSDPAVRTRLEAMLGTPSVRESLVAAGFLPAADTEEDDGEKPERGLGVDELLERLAAPEMVQRMRSIATSPDFRQRLQQQHADQQQQQKQAQQQTEAQEPLQQDTNDAAPPSALASADESESSKLMKKLQAVRDRQPSPCSNAQLRSLSVGEAVLAEHNGDGVWYSAVLASDPYTIRRAAATVARSSSALSESGSEERGDGSEKLESEDKEDEKLLVCDVAYVDGDIERAVPPSRIALRDADDAISPSISTHTQTKAGIAARVDDAHAPAAAAADAAQPQAAAADAPAAPLESAGSKEAAEAMAADHVPVQQQKEAGASDGVAAEGMAMPTAVEGESDASELNAVAPFEESEGEDLLTADLSEPDEPELAALAPVPVEDDNADMPQPADSDDR